MRLWTIDLDQPEKHVVFQSFHHYKGMACRTEVKTLPSDPEFDSASIELILDRIKSTLKTGNSAS